MINRLNKLKLSLILVAIICILCLLDFSYSRYKSIRSGQIEGRVLKWYFELVDGIQATDEIDFPITRTDNNSNVADGKIAPGTSGNIPIVIDTTGCEVDTECEIEITIENCPTNMVFKNGSSDELLETQRSGTGDENDPKIAVVTYNFFRSVQNHGVIEKNINWQWDYLTEGSPDEVDNFDIQKDEISFNIKVIGTQENVPEHVFVMLDGDTLRFRNYDYTEEEKSGNTYYGDYINVASSKPTDSSYSQRPWYIDRNLIEYVDFETPIKPIRMDFWFYEFSNLKAIKNIANIDTTNTTSMACLFMLCSSLTNLDISNFNTSNVTSIYSMFNQCSSLISLDVSNFDTSNVTSMNHMFYQCSNLTVLDLSSFNTSNVRNMNRMFYGCSRIRQLDLSNFNTTNVKDMGLMFCMSTRLIELDISSFDTSNVTDMEHMFSYCQSLTQIDISSFDTSSVTEMAEMFRSCSNLVTIYVDDFTIASSSSNMFYLCSSLIGGSGTTYSSLNVDGTYARIDNQPDYPGYFTLKTS